MPLAGADPPGPGRHRDVPAAGRRNVASGSRPLRPPGSEPPRRHPACGLGRSGPHEQALESRAEPGSATVLDAGTGTPDTGTLIADTPDTSEGDSGATSGDSLVSDLGWDGDGVLAS